MLASQKPNPETSLPYLRRIGFFKSARHEDELMSTTTSMLDQAKSELYRRIGSGNDRDIMLVEGEFRKPAWTRNAPRRESLLQ